MTRRESPSIRAFLSTATLALLAPSVAAADRAVEPAAATVFVRVIGTVRVELEEPWTESFEEREVELGTGTGFVISPYGHVLTNEHVLRGTTRPGTVRGRAARVELRVERIEVGWPAPGGDERVPAQVDAADAELDLAVLSIGAASLPYLALGDSDAVEIGQPVSVLGFPFGRQIEIGATALPDLVPRVSQARGTIAALRPGDDGRTRYLQTTAALNPGNSGGPLVDEEGFVLGVVRSRLAEAANVGFAIPVNVVKEFLEAHGLDGLLPVRRVGPLEPVELEDKGVALWWPAGAEDVWPSRLRVRTAALGDERDGPVLVVDRVATSWPTERLEEAILGGALDAFRATTAPRRWTRPPQRERALRGSVSGRSLAGDEPFKMEYVILGEGRERIVARYVGPEESVAFDLSTLRSSLDRVAFEPWLAEGAAERRAAAPTAWRLQPMGSSGAPALPLPAGWIVDGSGPFPCPGLAPPDAVLAAFPPGDFTLSLRAAWWRVGPGGDEPAARCAGEAGVATEATYRTGASWLGIDYVIEGLFATGAAGVVQLELVAPVETAPAARTAFEAWVGAMEEAGNVREGTPRR